MGSSKTKIPVSPRALIARINRHLRQKDQALRIARSPQAAAFLGRYYTLDLQRNRVLNDHLDLEGLGRTLEVLAPYEALAE